MGGVIKMIRFVQQKYYYKFKPPDRGVFWSNWKSKAFPDVNILLYKCISTHLKNAKIYILLLLRHVYETNVSFSRRSTSIVSYTSFQCWMGTACLKCFKQWRGAGQALRWTTLLARPHLMMCLSTLPTNNVTSSPLVMLRARQEVMTMATLQCHQWRAAIQRAAMLTLKKLSRWRQRRVIVVLGTQYLTMMLRRRKDVNNNNNNNDKDEKFNCIVFCVILCLAT